MGETWVDDLDPPANLFEHVNERPPRRIDSNVTQTDFSIRYNQRGNNKERGGRQIACNSVITEGAERFLAKNRDAFVVNLNCSPAFPQHHFGMIPGGSCFDNGRFARGEKSGEKYG